jgi:hypothetical protein
VAWSLLTPLSPFQRSSHLPHHKRPQGHGGLSAEPEDSAHHIPGQRHGKSSTSNVQRANPIPVTQNGGFEAWRREQYISVRGAPTCSKGHLRAMHHRTGTDDTVSTVYGGRKISRPVLATSMSLDQCNCNSRALRPTMKWSLTLVDVPVHCFGFGDEMDDLHCCRITIILHDKIHPYPWRKKQQISATAGRYQQLGGDELSSTWESKRG